MTTAYQKFPTPLDREQLLEDFLRERLEEIGSVFGNTFISGLRLEYVSASSIRVGTGEADLPDKSRRLRVSTPITVTGIAPGASKWSHAYLYNNAGSQAVEVISQDTATPANYLGTGYGKGVDTSRRYLGSVRTNASGQIINFQHDPQTNFVRYLADISASPLAVLSAGAALVQTSVSCAGVVPVTSRRALIRLDNNAPNALAFAKLGVSGVDGVAFVNAPSSPVYDVPLSTAQAFTYALNAAPTSGGLYAQLMGYFFER